MQRRSFLVGSAAAAQSLLGQSPADKVSTAMIGVGSRGSTLLRGVLQQSNARVVAVCDIRPDRLDKAASMAARDNPKSLTDWHKILEMKDVEAVYIAAPPHLHSEMAIAALQAGKHVYCEKPVGITPQQVSDVVKAAKASNKVFQAGQQLRSMKVYQEAMRRIRDGAIGDVIWVKAQRHGNADLPHDTSTGEWYFDVNKSSGYLVEMSVHNLDLINWAVGAHPLRAEGKGTTVFYKNDPPGRSIFDSGSLTYEYPGGVLMSFTQMVFHPRGLPLGGQYIHVYGSKGAVDLMGGTNFYPLDPQAQPSLLVPKQTESEFAHLEAFYNCIQKGAASPAGIETGATAALTAIMGHQAMTSGRPVEWKDLGVEL